MVALHLNVSLRPLNVSRLSMPIKSQIVRLDYKPNPNICLRSKRPHTEKQKVKG